MSLRPLSPYVVFPRMDVPGYPGKTQPPISLPLLTRAGGCLDRWALLLSPGRDRNMDHGRRNVWPLRSHGRGTHRTSRKTQSHPHRRQPLLGVWRPTTPRVRFLHLHQLLLRRRLTVWAGTRQPRSGCRLDSDLRTRRQRCLNRLRTITDQVGQAIHGGGRGSKTKAMTRNLEVQLHARVHRPRALV